MKQPSSNKPYNESDHFVDDEEEDDDDLTNCPYTILNLPHNASLSDVQRNFKQLSRIYHPDKVGHLRGSSNVASVAGTPFMTPVDGIDTNADTDYDDRVDRQYTLQIVAQQAFIRIKTAADILSDPVYRMAYTHGGHLAVMLVKRSQALSASPSHNMDKSSGRGDENEHDQDDSSSAIDLYTLLQQHLYSEEHVAASIIDEFVDEYHRHQKEQQQQRHDENSSQLEVSCAMPHVIVPPLASTLAMSLRNLSYLQRESATVTVRSRNVNLFGASPKLTGTWSASSELSHMATIKVTTSCGIDYQPVPGTRIKTDVMLRPFASASNSGSKRQSPAALSVQTTRQTASGTVLVAMIGGNVPTLPTVPNKLSSKEWKTSLSSWNASFLSSKLLLWESLWGRPAEEQQQPSQSNNAATEEEPTKVMATWRISFHPFAGQLAHFMAGLRSHGCFPQWSGRLALMGTSYPLKVSYRGDETDTFYATYSWNMLASRVKLVRISSFDTASTTGASGSASASSSSTSWTLTYGVKYDGLARLSGRPAWSIPLHLQSDAFSLRLPIAVETVTPIAWLVSVVCALFVDYHFEAFMSQSDSAKDTNTGQRRQRVHEQKQLDENDGIRPWSDVMSRVAAKKRQLAVSSNGLVVHRALCSVGKSEQQQEQQQRHRRMEEYDLTDVLNFWVVDNQTLGPMSLTDSRLWWHFNGHPHTRASSGTQTSKEPASWWDWLGRGENEQDESVPTVDALGSGFDFCDSLTIRYQYGDTMYEVYLVHGDTVQLPHPKATELGPASRIR